jgi:site-specific DNA-methyltransferase (adenine-specific)
MCEWGEVNFVNPPYNKTDKPKFIQRAVDMQARGKTSVLLIPAATSTHQFHDLIVPNAEVRFLRGRVKFVGADGTSSKAGKHDSMVCVFKGKKK